MEGVRTKLLIPEVNSGASPLAPPFGELGQEGIRFVKNHTGLEAKIYTQMSDLIAGISLIPGTESRGYIEIFSIAENKTHKINWKRPKTMHVIVQISWLFRDYLWF